MKIKLWQLAAIAAASYLSGYYTHDKKLQKYDAMCRVEHRVLQKRVAEKVLSAFEVVKDQSATSEQKHAALDEAFEEAEFALLAARARAKNLGLSEEDL